jgi:hypothetical protein
MAFLLHCPVCGVATGSADDNHSPPPRKGLGHVGAECTLHHPNPVHHRDLQPPPGRTTIVVNVPKEK